VPPSLLCPLIGGLSVPFLIGHSELGMRLSWSARYLIKPASWMSLALLAEPSPRLFDDGTESCVQCERH